jgi:pyruvate dehydrogenase E1 component alpha subunit
MTTQTTSTYYQILNPDGELVNPMPSLVSHPGLVEFYRLMVLTRTFDERAVSLQRTGKLCTYPSCKGQEGVAIATGHALRADDIYCPYYRDQGAMLARGVTLLELLRYWAGDERGSDFTGPREDFPIAIPIATQLLHAVGAAYAIKLRNQDRVIVAMCGDGATSEGDFYEALNLAGIWHLPIVFVINNNQWAISVPRKAQSATPTLAEKATSGGFIGTQVDGNDVIACYDLINQAVGKARIGAGPQLIEALTYRLSDHTTADDARRYCPDEELEKAWQLEPISRTYHYLKREGLLSNHDDEQIWQQCRDRTDEAVDMLAQDRKEPAPAMFDSLYENFPEPLLDQYMAIYSMNQR